MEYAPRRTSRLFEQRLMTVRSFLICMQLIVLLMALGTPKGWGLLVAIIAQIYFVARDDNPRQPVRVQRLPFRERLYNLMYEESEPYRELCGPGKQ